MAEFPRCALCRVTIQAGTSVVFREDGRVAHVDCPEVVCPVCTRHISPGDPIRRDGDTLLHGNCWLKRHRTLLAGGCADSPWSVVFEHRLARVAPFERAAFRELRDAVRDVCAESFRLCELARSVRSRLPHAV
jgi:hypothetical protein